MFFGILDQQGHLEFINAGHPSPILIRRGVAEEAFTEGSYPVGLVPEAQYTAVCLKLEPGDTLVLFSDGVTEAADPDEQMFGTARLKELLTGQLECPLEQLQKCVLEAVENFARGAHQADDLTLLIVRYRANRGHHGHGCSVIFFVLSFSRFRLNAIVARSSQDFIHQLWKQKNRASAEVIGLRPVFNAWISSACVEKALQLLGAISVFRLTHRDP